jgi:hypothetical protein
MIELLILAFVVGLALGMGFLIALDWLVKRQARALINSKSAIVGSEKRQNAKSEKTAMILDLKAVLDSEGDFKGKLGKIVGVAGQYPNATEELFKQLRRFI